MAKGKGKIQTYIMVFVVRPNVHEPDCLSTVTLAKGKNITDIHLLWSVINYKISRAGVDITFNRMDLCYKTLQNCFLNLFTRALDQPV